MTKAEFQYRFPSGRPDVEDDEHDPRPGRWEMLGDWSEAPHAPGCYAALHRGVVVYVGSSSDLNRRLRAHSEKARGAEDHWMARRGIYFKIRTSAKYGDWAMVELRLIRRLKPEFNLLLRPGAVQRVRLTGWRVAADA